MTQKSKTINTSINTKAVNTSAAAADHNTIYISVLKKTLEQNLFFL